MVNGKRPGPENHKPHPLPWGAWAFLFVWVKGKYLPEPQGKRWPETFPNLNRYHSRRYKGKKKFYLKPTAP
jgi:hypothetical protein